jgi:hypothetical protein
MLARRLSTLLALAIFSAFVPFLSAAIAQEPPANASTPLPSDAALDALLAVRNWDALGGCFVATRHKRRNRKKIELAKNKNGKWWRTASPHDLRS